MADGQISVADGWLAAGLTLLAWLHRLAFLRSNRDWSWPYTVFYEGDSEAFFDYARALLAGRAYDGGIPFHPPGFAWLLALIHTGLGAGAPNATVPYVAVKATLALVGSASIGLAYLLARPYLGRPTALVGALLGTYSFGLYVLHVAPVTEGTYQTLLLLCLLLWTRWLDHPLAVPRIAPAPDASWWRPLVLGLLLGALALVRAEGALVAMALGMVGLVGWAGKHARGSDHRPGLRPWALLLLGWVLAVSPWMLRNYWVLAATNQRLHLAEPLPTLVPVTLYGPINLALANNPLADGTFSRSYLAAAAHLDVLDLENPEHLRFLLHGDAMARDWALANPGAAGRLLLRKWRLVADAWRLGWTQWNWPGGLDGIRRPIDVFVPNGAAALWLQLPLTVLGLVICLAVGGGPRRWAAIVLLATAVCLLTTGLFFGYARQGLLYLPLWLSLQAVAWWTMGQSLAQRRLAVPGADTTPGLPRRLVLSLAGVAVVLLALEAWGATANRNFSASGTTLPGSQKLDPDQPVTLRVLPR